jgi:hypothetical protein
VSGADDAAETYRPHTNQLKQNEFGGLANLQTVRTQKNSTHRRTLQTHGPNQTRLPKNLRNQANRLGRRWRYESGFIDAGAGLSLSADGDPPEEVVELLKARKPDIVAHLQAERRRINHWIADKLIDWPPAHCLHCRKPIVVGQNWAAVG